jgi:hypothetical protein
MVSPQPHPPVCPTTRPSHLTTKELADALDRKLAAIFDHARGLRNQSGHPSGDDVTAEDAEAGLLLFPGFCDLVDKLITVVKAI